MLLRPFARAGEIAALNAGGAAALRAGAVAG
jgi:hypothetical protein